MTIGRFIIGANYGDEGKGTVTAYYAKHATGKVLNVLTNGGPQRGHTVVTDKGTYTFKHFGSGTCYGAHNYFAQDFIVNPMQFMKEIKELHKDFIVKAYMNSSCRWTTPYDMMANQIIERNRRKRHEEHGTCGMGIWETMKRTVNCLNINLDAFANLTTDLQKNYLTNIKTYYELKYFATNEYSMTEEELSIWNSRGLMKHFIEDCKDMMHLVTVVGSMPKDYDEYLFENGQGLLLDGCSADDIHTTPSCTGVDSFFEDMSFIDQLNIHYVTRPYLTRHGAGPFGDVKRNTIASSIQDDLMNHYNEFQGDFRYGTLDISKLKERVDKDSSIVKTPKNVILEITHCDEMDREDEFKKYFKNYHIFDSAKV